MKTFNNDKGAVLITILILMAIITLIGIIAINTSTVEIQISGNTRRVATAFEGAEAGIDLSIPLIENSIANGVLTPSNITFPPTSGTTATIINSANLQNRIFNNVTGTAAFTFNRDISISNLNGVNVDINIDRLYTYLLPGGASQFAMGYEGVGAGTAGSGGATLYRIDSQGTR